MTAPDTVLVLTGRLDATADLVITELDRRGVPVFRCDPADFPDRIAVSARFDTAAGWSGTLRTPYRSVELGRIVGAWYRRPGRIAVRTDPATADQPEAAGVDTAGAGVDEWASAEARGGFGGLLAAVPRWLNDPGRMEHAEYKPVQLAAAARAGLAAPRTLITTDPAAAREFVAGLPHAVYKPFRGSLRAADGTRFIYTSAVTAAEIDDSVRYTAHQFQEWIDKDHEVRLTVVGDRYFAARLTARSEAARTDWRSDYDSVDYAVTEVPDGVRAAVARMLAELGLRFAAMDFVVRPDGRWYFLDLNPNGQWGWIEHHTGLPICAAIADELTASVR
ncbi:ATP-grasp ribosomal peptide maturase [Actinocatenispora thailandica]|uniref:ATP-grasp ribosomal peptide maturase n=1 Tax=Actinocatenispora thailandica TaxID=227318 RepID=A0A7R7DWM9_9ACTN|nr:ATP-grasp ribosomal peptide maturase [Actinocatenispora thailandica]BCJ39114.1 ATP-grasp ribosomal peptide maturase [Actinocatenispora thailandica]